MIEHCISLFKKKQQEKVYRVYLTDGLMVLSQTLAKVYGGSELKSRYYELIEPQKEETRTSDEIIADITAKLKALGGDDDEPIRFNGEDNAEQEGL